MDLKGWLMCFFLYCEDLNISHVSTNVYSILMIGQKHIIPQFWLREVQKLGLLGLSVLLNTRFF